MLKTWTFPKRILAAVVLGFALGTGLHAGRRSMVPTSYSIVQIDESISEIPWEWIPGLVIVRSEQSPPEEMAPVVQERPSRIERIAELLQRVRDRFARFASERPSLTRAINEAAALASPAS